MMVLVLHRMAEEKRARELVIINLLEATRGSPSHHVLSLGIKHLRMSLFDSSGEQLFETYSLIETYDMNLFNEILSANPKLWHRLILGVSPNPPWLWMTVLVDYQVRKYISSDISICPFIVD